MVLPLPPSTTVFAEHGLTNVTIDIPGTDLGGSPSLAALPITSRSEPWISGWATLTPTEPFPLISVPDDLEDVRFVFCSNKEYTAVHAFRRRCQLLALDTLPCSPGPSFRFGRVKQVLAWWEDSHGYWFITKADKVGRISLQDAWEKATNGPTGSYEAGCELLIRVVDCLNSLHAHGLTLQACRPTAFVVRVDNRQINLTRFSEVLPLPTFSVPPAAFRMSSLFADGLTDMETISEAFVSNNLRFLAPETAGTRQAAKTGDIYSFGVLAYELLTGTTIDGGPNTPSAREVDLLSDIHRHVTADVTPPRTWLEREAHIGSVTRRLPSQVLDAIIMRCIAKDPIHRYASLDAVKYDLENSNPNLIVGQIDRISRFTLPTSPVNREKQLEALQTAYDHSERLQIVNLYGGSGTGKTRIVRQFVTQFEGPKAEHDALIAWCKLDESTQTPLYSFVQLFQALIDRMLTDPREDAQEWISTIQMALSAQYPALLPMLSEDCLKLLGKGGGTIASAPVSTAAFPQWASRFLQLFGSPSRPLILIIDDAHCMSESEHDLWRNVVSSDLHNLLIVSTERTERPRFSLSSSSSSSKDVYVPPFDVQGVLKLINVCLHDAVEKPLELASLIFAETQGLSLYVRTLLATLVDHHVLYFDFDLLKWRFDPIAIQSHLSTSGLDAYVERIIKDLSPPVRDLLYMLSCLPSAGSTISQLCGLLGVSRAELESTLRIAVNTASLLNVTGEKVKYVHDRPRAVAYHLIPSEQAASIHQRVSELLRQPDMRSIHIYDAVEHALTARKLGVPISDAELLALLLDAAGQATRSSIMDNAKRYVDAADAMNPKSYGQFLYLRYLQVSIELASSLKQDDVAAEKLDEFESLCNSQTDRISLATLRVKLYMARDQILQAVDCVVSILRETGYDTEQGNFNLPSTPQKLEESVSQLQQASIDERDQRAQLLSLLGVACGPIWVCEPTCRGKLFEIGVFLALQLGGAHEATATLLAALALQTDDLVMKRAYTSAAYKIVKIVPDVTINGAAMLGLAAQAHCWSGLQKIGQEVSQAFSVNISNGSYDYATYALTVDLAAQLLSAQKPNWEGIITKYDGIKDAATPAIFILVHIWLQYAEQLASIPTSEQDPWSLDGVFASSVAVESLPPLVRATRQCLTLRLAILYDAPVTNQLALATLSEDCSLAMEGMLVQVEWLFLTAICAARQGQWDKLKTHVDETRGYQNPDFVDRIVVLESLEQLKRGGFDSLYKVEQGIEKLNARNQNLLSGMLSLWAGEEIERHTKSRRMALGFHRAAYKSYTAADAYGPASAIRSKYPEISSTPLEAALLPSEILGVGKESAPPELVRQASMVTAKRPSISSESALSSQEDKDRRRAEMDDNLDTLTLMRSALALASEQDPDVLLCTLMRILCQFVRADYAAVALFEESDNTAIRLRAAGPFSRILPYDIDILSETAAPLCPVTMLLHTARTGKSITSIPNNSRFRSDPFFIDRQPQSVLCLPVLIHGEEAGVVLLSSMTSASVKSRSSRAREVVSALATFATIVTANFSFTRRLEQEVTQRTKQLSDALAAKTTFLSQCSHELRSPLSAVLGLSAVLEASPGLSQVQREHLRTIISSGEDLLGLINNILDHSRLESGSVTLEHIPFSVRDVTENALDSVAAVAQKKNLELCLTTSILGDPPALIGDPFRIKQIFINLLSNACKFTSKGSITVHYDYVKQRDSRFKVTITVKDTGVGIPEEKMGKLFQSFSQVDESITRSYGGSGLGLIISKDLARLLGGDCTAESDYGEGSTFTFSFVSDEDKAKPFSFKTFKEPKSCFILCEGGPWWDMLDQNLGALNCRPVRFAEDTHLCLKRDHPDGLNSSKNFDFIFLQSELIDKATLTRMRELQPKSKYVFLVKSVNLATAMRDFGIDRNAIVARPIKFRSILQALIPDAGDTLNTKDGKKRQPINKELAKTSPMKILLVDDNKVNLSVGKRILEMYGYDQVATAADGQQAVDEAEKKEYDLILLDLQMPIMDGFSAQQKILESEKAGKPCIVALTANADESTRRECEEAKFFDYISKPLDITRLGKILQNAYDHQQQNQNGKKT